MRLDGAGKARSVDAKMQFGFVAGRRHEPEGKYALTQTASVAHQNWVARGLHDALENVGDW